MNGVVVNFNDMRKSERSEYINGIWGINQILKNTFLSFYLDNQGKIFSDKLNKLENGIHCAESELTKYIPVPEEFSFLRLDSTKIYEVIKDYKSLLEGIFYKEDGIYFRIKDVGDVIFGKLVPGFNLPDNDIVHRVNMMLHPDEISIEGKLYDDEIEALVDKQVVEKMVANYYMIVAHKLFPSIKKCNNNKIGIEDYRNGFFGGTFALEYDITNSSGKKRFSKLTTYHKYNFIYM